jgi:sulfite reductase (NADPH) flavoprotein alpha-component
MSDFERIALALLLALFYGALCGFCFRRRSLKPRIKVEPSGVLVAYASQSGRAHALAEKIAEAFAGRAVLCSLNQLPVSPLSQVTQLIVVASTYGAGEAPDNGAVFAKNLNKLPADTSLKNTQFAVVALGDSYYPDFCAFGRRVYLALQRLGAQALAGSIELDASKPQQEHTALQQLHRLIDELGGHFDSDTAQGRVVPARHKVILQQRQLLNAGSPGSPLYHLTLSAADTLNYSAGDIAELYPRHNAALCKQQLRALGLAEEATISIDRQTLPAWRWLASRQWPLPVKPKTMPAAQWLKSLPEEAPRQYTIANAYSPHTLHLVVRQQRNHNHELGLASGWLTQELALHGELELAIRDNQEFHTPPAHQPLILIGNGSGIAGLRAHLQHRAHTGGEPCWLLYGERDAHTDRPFADELAQLQRQGVILQLDCVYSRCPKHPAYVQQRLQQRSEQLTHWLGRNACIYVCGSRVGMGQGVHDVLLSLLGEQALDELQAAGRYRRDVY